MKYFLCVWFMRFMMVATLQEKMRNPRWRAQAHDVLYFSYNEIIFTFFLIIHKVQITAILVLLKLSHQVEYFLEATQENYCIQVYYYAPFYFRPFSLSNGPNLSWICPYKVFLFLKRNNMRHLKSMTNKKNMLLIVF